MRCARRQARARRPHLFEEAVDGIGQLPDDEQVVDADLHRHATG